VITHRRANKCKFSHESEKNETLKKQKAEEDKDNPSVREKGAENSTRDELQMIALAGKTLFESMENLNGNDEKQIFYKSLEARTF